MLKRPLRKEHSNNRRRKGCNSLQLHRAANLANNIVKWKGSGSNSRKLGLKLTNKPTFSWNKVSEISDGDIECLPVHLVCHEAPHHAAPQIHPELLGTGVTHPYSHREVEFENQVCHVGKNWVHTCRCQNNHSQKHWYATEVQAKLVWRWGHQKLKQWPTTTVIVNCIEMAQT